MASGAGAAVESKKKLGIWDFLNSQFGLWLLGSVVLAAITGYWNNRNDRRADDQKTAQQQLVEQQRKAQQELDDRRKDSEFLVSMLPYLSHKDEDVRLRAVSVVSARYPEDKVPPEVQRIMAQAIGGVKPTEQNQSTYGKVVKRLDNPIVSDSQVDAAVASSAQDLPRRVYIQIYQESQLGPAQKIQTLLRKEKFVVPGIENVSSKGAGVVRQTQVRYFNDQDKDAAERVKTVLAENGFRDAVVTRLSAKNPGVIEIWFKP
jgi:hypothetical protein